MSSNEISSWMSRTVKLYKQQAESSKMTQQIISDDFQDSHMSRSKTIEGFASEHTNQHHRQHSKEDTCPEIAYLKSDQSLENSLKLSARSRRLFSHATQKRVSSLEPMYLNPSKISECMTENDPSQFFEGQRSTIIQDDGMCGDTYYEEEDNYQQIHSFSDKNSIKKPSYCSDDQFKQQNSSLGVDVYVKSRKIYLVMVLNVNDFLNELRDLKLFYEPLQLIVNKSKDSENASTQLNLTRRLEMSFFQKMLSPHRISPIRVKVIRIPVRDLQQNKDNSCSQPKQKKKDLNNVFDNMEDIAEFVNQTNENKFSSPIKRSKFTSNELIKLKRISLSPQQNFSCFYDNMLKRVNDINQIPYNEVKIEQNMVLATQVSLKNIHLSDVLPTPKGQTEVFQVKKRQINEITPSKNIPNLECNTVTTNKVIDSQRTPQDVQGEIDEEEEEKQEDGEREREDVADFTSANVVTDLGESSINGDINPSVSVVNGVTDPSDTAVNDVSDPIVTPVGSVGGVKSVSASNATGVGGVKSVSVSNVTGVGGVKRVSVSNVSGVGGVKSVSVSNVTGVGGMKRVSVSNVTGAGGVRSVSQEQQLSLSPVRKRKLISFLTPQKKQMYGKKEQCLSEKKNRAIINDDSSSKFTTMYNISSPPPKEFNHKIKDYKDSSLQNVIYRQYKPKESTLFEFIPPPETEKRDQQPNIFYGIRQHSITRRKSPAQTKGKQMLMIKYNKQPRVFDNSCFLPQTMITSMMTAKIPQAKTQSTIFEDDVVYQFKPVTESKVKKPLIQSPLKSSPIKQTEVYPRRISFDLGSKIQINIIASPRERTCMKHKTIQKRKLDAKRSVENQVLDIRFVGEFQHEFLSRLGINSTRPISDSIFKDLFFNYTREELDFIFGQFLICANQQTHFMDMPSFFDYQQISLRQKMETLISSVLFTTFGVIRDIFPQFSRLKELGLLKPALKYILRWDQRIDEYFQSGKEADIPFFWKEFFRVKAYFEDQKWNRSEKFHFILNLINPDSSPLFPIKKIHLLLTDQMKALQPMQTKQLREYLLNPLFLIDSQIPFSRITDCLHKEVFLQMNDLLTHFLTKQ